MLNNDKESKKYRVFSNGFEDKLNLLFQYLILINLVMKRANSFDIKTYILNGVTMALVYAFYNGSHCIKDENCKFFYENMLSYKFKNPCY